MIYQLIHHDNVNFTTVEQSKDLQTEQEKTNWYSRTIFGKQLPEGRQWGVIDSNHNWFVRTVDSELPLSVDAELPLSFDEVVRISHDRTLEERKQQFESNQRYSEHMRNFEG